MLDAPADRFVVLGGAIQSAVEAADLPLACEAADRMADGHVLDGLQVKASAAMKIPPMAYGANAEDVPACSRQPLRAAHDRFEAARERPRISIGEPPARPVVGSRRCRG